MFPTSPIFDLEYDLMSYCLKHWGKWWATHFWPNREAKEMYAKLRALDAGTVIAILGDGGSDWEKQVRIYNEVVKPVLEWPTSGYVNGHLPGYGCEVD